MSRKDTHHQLKVWITNELWEQLCKEAQEGTISDLVRKALEDYLCQQKDMNLHQSK